MVMTFSMYPKVQLYVRGSSYTCSVVDDDGVLHVVVLVLNEVRLLSESGVFRLRDIECGGGGGFCGAGLGIRLNIC